MAYTVEITDGSSTYTFGVTNMPNWSIATETEYDETKYPAVILKSIDTLTLNRCSYRNATPSNVTSDWTTLKTLLFERLTPIESVILKDGSTTIEEMTTTTHDQLMIMSMVPDAGVGFFANHWLGTIVVKGVALKADAFGVVKKIRNFSYSWDQHGFETRTVDVEVQTRPGTSASSKMASEAISLPASTWFYVTNSDDGINYSITEDSEDTHANGVSTVKEQAIALPAGTNEFTVKVEEIESGDVTTITVQADTLSKALSVAKSNAHKPSRYSTRRLSQDKTRNRVVATYINEFSWTDSKFGIRSWSVSFAGAGRARSAIMFPGRNPIEFLSPTHPYVIRETIILRDGSSYHSGDSPVDLTQYKVPSIFSKADHHRYLDTKASSDTVSLVKREEYGSDTWQRSVVNVFKIFDIDRCPPPKTMLDQMKRDMGQYKQDYLIHRIQDQLP